MDIFTKHNFILQITRDREWLTIIDFFSQKSKFIIMQMVSLYIYSQLFKALHKILILAFGTNMF